MSLESTNEIASLVGADRATVVRRADQLGMIPVDGPKGAKLYETREILMLVPIPSRSTSTDSGGATLEEARIRQTEADARLKELQAQRLEGTLASIDELLEWQNQLHDLIATRIKESSMTEQEKEDVMSSISAAAREWEKMT